MKTKHEIKKNMKLIMLAPIIPFAIMLFGCQSNESEKNDKTEDKSEIIKDTPKPETIEGEIYDVVDEMPVYGKNPEDLSKYLSSNIKYPQSAKEKGIQGKVFVSFVVSKSGKVANSKIEKSVNDLLDKEALRVISTMPDWTPGKNKGVAVNAKLTIPIQFKLN